MTNPTTQSASATSGELKPGLPDLARLFADAFENRKEVTLSTYSCGLLYSAMTTASQPVAAAPAAQAALPPTELTWLFTHCRAIGMTCKSTSGKWEHDIALFTLLQQTEIANLRAALQRPAPAQAAGDERVLFETWTRSITGMPDVVPFVWDSEWVTFALQGWMARAALAQQAEAAPAPVMFAAKRIDNGEYGSWLHRSRESAETHLQGNGPAAPKYKIVELVELAAPVGQAEAAEPVAGKFSAEPFSLYQAVNDLMVHIGMNGEINSQHDLVDKVMDELHKLDGGNVAQRVEDLVEKASMPRDQATRLAVDEYCAIGSDRAAVPVTAAAGGELPPLPETKYCADDLADIFTADQMRDYAIAAIAASRAQPANVKGRTAAEWYIAYCEKSEKLKAANGAIERYKAERAQPAQAGADEATQAARDVLAERRRQVEKEGYDHTHDDEHVNDEIAALATYYAMPPGAREWPAHETGYGSTWGRAIMPLNWVANTHVTRRQELVKAGALILAEIERIDRAALDAATQPTQQGESK